MKYLKSILKKRPKIPRESKKKCIKRKVYFPEDKNTIKEYNLTEYERYDKKISWYKIRRLVKYR